MTLSIVDEMSICVFILQPDAGNYRCDEATEKVLSERGLVTVTA